MRNALITLLLVLLVGLTLTAKEFEAAATQAGVVSADGRVEKQVRGGGWVGCAVGDILVTGDKIRTQANSSASLLFTDKTVMRMGAATTITLVDLSETADGKLVRKLAQQGGRTWSDVTPNPAKPTTYEVHGPNAVAAVKGTSFEMDAESAETDVLCWEGEVECQALDGGPPARITAGAGLKNRFKAARGRRPVEESFNPDEYVDGFRNWNIQNRDLQRAQFAKLPPRVKFEPAQLRGWAAKNRIKLTTNQRLKIKRFLQNRPNNPGQRPPGRPPGGNRPR